MHKSAELADFASQQPLTQDGNTLRWHSNCYPVFNDYREKFYHGRDKVISMETLDGLKDIGLAVWFGDCGRTKKGCAVINTCKFRQQGSETIARYFNEIGIETSTFTERGNYRILMSKAGTEKFLMTVGHRLPAFMFEKLEV